MGRPGRDQPVGTVSPAGLAVVAHLCRRAGDGQVDVIVVVRRVHGHGGIAPSGGDVGDDFRGDLGLDVGIVILVFHVLRHDGVGDGDLHPFAHAYPHDLGVLAGAAHGVHQPVDLEYVALQVAEGRVADAHGRVVGSRAFHQTAQLRGARAQPGLDGKVVVQHLYFILQEIRGTFLRYLLRGDFLALELVRRPAAQDDAQRPQDLAAAEGGLRTAADEEDLVHVVVQDRPEAVEIMLREAPGDGV